VPSRVVAFIDTAFPESVRTVQHSDSIVWPDIAYHGKKMISDPMYEPFRMMAEAGCAAGTRHASRAFRGRSASRRPLRGASPGREWGRGEEVATRIPIGREATDGDRHHGLSPPMSAGSAGCWADELKGRSGLGLLSRTRPDAPRPHSGGPPNVACCRGLALGWHSRRRPFVIATSVP
jgi:hypothetical protein